MGITFKKAVKYEAKGRIALIGPAGSGKSWTMLTMARALVGEKGKIACIDTEHGSLSKYADIFNFDVFEMTSYSPNNFMEALKAAEGAGYAAFCVDSLSHFWAGKDGALEFVDVASKKYRDNMGGWKEFRPHERSMVDAMIASPCHILCTMRTKTEYQEQVNQQTGKKQRVKIGLAPVQRDGLEYEFDLIGYMDNENTFIVDKTRCPDLNQKSFIKPKAEDFQTFVHWLAGEKKAEEPVQPKPEVKLNVIAKESPVDETRATTPDDEGHISKITEPQRKRFYAIWKTAGKTPEEVKERLLSIIGSESSADITVDVYQDLCTWAKGELNIKTALEVNSPWD